MQQATGIRSSRTLAQRGVLAYSPAHIPLGDQRDVLSEIGGLVLPGWAGIALATKLRTSGFKGRLLIDPAEYADATKRDDDQAQLFDASGDWLGAQCALGVDMALSPARYVQWEDWSGMLQVLSTGSKFCDRAVKRGVPPLLVLPLSARFLATRIDRLAAALQRVPFPIGLVVADKTDPFRTKPVLPRLIQLIDALPHIAVLRSDHSAIGLAAFGARIGAIGVTSATRHLVPPGQEGGGSRGDRSPSLFVEVTGMFMRGSKLERLEARRDLLLCFCRVCDGQSLVRFGDPRLKDEARRHSLSSWSILATRVLSAPRAKQRAAWIAYCKRADWARAELESATGVILRNDALTNWLRLAP